MIRHLRDRADVDERRIAVVGYGESGWVAMLAAAKERRITALGLVAAPSTRGVEFVLEQQRQMLVRMEISDEERLSKMELQRRIHDAVLTGDDWDDIPPDMRKQADTPWFSSYLNFWPADVIQDLRQPMVVIHGGLDRQIVPGHADRLLEMGLARDRRVATELVRFDALNHLLVPAVTGEVNEYPTLETRSVSVELISALGEKLHKIMPSRR